MSRYFVLSFEICCRCSYKFLFSYGFAYQFVVSALFVYKQQLEIVNANCIYLDDYLVVSGFNWDPFPFGSGVNLGTSMEVLLNFEVESVNKSVDVENFLSSHNQLFTSVQPFMSIDPLLSYLDDSALSFVTNDVKEVAFDSTKTRFFNFFTWTIF